MGLTKALGAKAGSMRIFALLALAILAGFALAPAVFAAEPQAWQIGMQPPATPVKDRLQGLHNELVVIITLITIFVLGLLVYVITRFNEKANPTPSRTSHNTLVEVIWTVLPVLILVIIAIPSFKLLYYMDKTQKADMTIKVTGHQWYWTYEYPDQGGISFDSNMIPVDELKPGQKRLLEVDNRLVVPVDTNIRVLVAGTDVLHSFFIPSFGVQQYAVVGRLNETWFNVEKAGVYYGQCNQICGVNHAFMPIAVEAVSKDDFNKWVDDKKKAAANGGAIHVAAHENSLAQPAAPVAAAQ
jgi:cytochrome c oxidase subunit II